MVKDDRHGITQSDYMKFKRAWDKHDALMKERLPDRESEIKAENDMPFGSVDLLTKYLLASIGLLLTLYVVKLYTLK